MAYVLYQPTEHAVRVLGELARRHPYVSFPGGRPWSWVLADFANFARTGLGASPALAAWSVPIKESDVEEFRFDHPAYDGFFELVAPDRSNARLVYTVPARDWSDKHPTHLKG